MPAKMVRNPDGTVTLSHDPGEAAAAQEANAATEKARLEQQARDYEHFQGLAQRRVDLVRDGLPDLTSDTASPAILTP
jgi:hypothetical protein